jgi:hypothetical protein
MLFKLKVASVLACCVKVLTLFRSRVNISLSVTNQYLGISTTVVQYHFEIRH